MGNVTVMTDPHIELEHFPKCEHSFTLPYEITVKGERVQIVSSPHADRGACGPCLEAYLNTYSIVCEACKGAITPLMQIALVSMDGNPEKVFIHVCCASLGALWGVWGEGVPRSLVMVG